jgi:hypothetical protein
VRFGGFRPFVTHGVLNLDRVIVIKPSFDCEKEDEDAHDAECGVVMPPR